MGNLIKTICPHCKAPTSEVVIRFYGHCLICERKEREAHKIEWQFENPEKRWQKLAFFRKIRGKAFKEWIKQRP